MILLQQSSKMRSQSSATQTCIVRRQGPGRTGHRTAFYLLEHNVHFASHSLGWDVCYIFLCGILTTDLLSIFWRGSFMLGRYLQDASQRGQRRGRGMVGIHHVGGYPVVSGSRARGSDNDTLGSLYLNRSKDKFHEVHDDVATRDHGRQATWTEHSGKSKLLNCLCQPAEVCRPTIRDRTISPVAHLSKFQPTNGRTR